MQIGGVDESLKGRKKKETEEHKEKRQIKCTFWQSIAPRLTISTLSSSFVVDLCFALLFSAPLASKKTL
jgi:hypothetical protein